MTSEDRIEDDNAFLNALIEETLALEDDPNPATFTHAFVKAGVSDALNAIRNGVPVGFQSTCRVFSSARKLANFALYLREQAAGTLIWLPQSSMQLSLIHI